MDSARKWLEQTGLGKSARKWLEQTVENQYLG